MAQVAPRAALAAAALLAATAGDTPPFTVILAPNATAPEQYAASELATQLGAALGAAVPTLPRCASGAGRCLGVGPGAALALGLAPTALEGLGLEGYVIRSSNLSVPGAVVASGGVGAPRGTVYASSGLLRLLGWRFFAPDETRVPSRAALLAAAGKPLEQRGSPSLIWRSVESHGTNGADPYQTPPTGTAAQQAANYAWATRQRNNGCCDTAGGSFPVWAGGSAHTAYTLLGESGTARSPPLALWNSHREWFW